MDVDGTLERVLISAALLIAVAWIALPFALFGLKPLLREILQELRDLKAIARGTPPPKM